MTHLARIILIRETAMWVIPATHVTHDQNQNILKCGLFLSSTKIPFIFLMHLVFEAKHALFGMNEKGTKL